MCTRSPGLFKAFIWQEYEIYIVPLAPIKRNKRPVSFSPNLECVPYFKQKVQNWSSPGWGGLEKVNIEKDLAKAKLVNNLQENLHSKLNTQITLSLACLRQTVMWKAVHFLSLVSPWLASTATMVSLCRELAAEMTKEGLGAGAAREEMDLMSCEV